jgi:hypothetical protein
MFEVQNLKAQYPGFGVLRLKVWGLRCVLAI